ncbi:MAG: lysylphosphatidylglycerol synthase transmembrane domain-containing protein [Acidimicrobiia bacterium]
MEHAETGAAHAPNRRARLMLGLRIVVSAALLALLISKIDLSVVVPRQHHLSTLGWLAAALVSAAVGIVLSAWRWQRVIDAFGVHVPLNQLTNHYFAGQFVGNVLPSTIGGDVLRVTRSAKSIGTTETAFAAVALERLTGFLALPALSLVGFVLDPSLLESDTAWVALLVSGIALAALGAILFLAGHPKAAGRFRDHQDWTRFLGAVHEGITRLRADRRQIGGVLGTAFVYQVSVIATVGFLSLTLGTGVPFAALVAFVPAVAMAQVVPISLSGLGIREGMLVLLLHPLGISNGHAVGLGLAWYAAMLIVSLAGAPSFAVGHRSKEPAAPADAGRPAMTSDVAE